MFNLELLWHVAKGAGSATTYRIFLASGAKLGPQTTHPSNRPRYMAQNAPNINSVGILTAVRDLYPPPSPRVNSMLALAYLCRGRRVGHSCLCPRPGSLINMTYVAVLASR
jgi:hypothetical protein